MIKTIMKLQDLKRKIYVKAKEDKIWRFWGIIYSWLQGEKLSKLLIKVLKKTMVLQVIDGTTFEAIEKSRVEKYLSSIRDELITKIYKPMRNRNHKIPKGNAQIRRLSIPSIRDRIIQGALKLILESVFEADFQNGSILVTDLNKQPMKQYKMLQMVL